MTQPEEAQAKTPKTDPVLLRPGEDPERRIDQNPPVRDPGEVRVERDGQLRPIEPEDGEDAT